MFNHFGLHCVSTDELIGGERRANDFCIYTEKEGDVFEALGDLFGRKNFGVN